MTQGVREGGHAVNMTAVIAIAVRGQRVIIGFDIVTTEDTAAWTAFLRSLVPEGSMEWSWSSPMPTEASMRPPGA